MTALYRLGEVCDAVGAVAVAGMDPRTPVMSVSIDSREIGPGALFVAIRGERFDGHDFVRQALDAGAVAALVDSVERAGCAPDAPLIAVGDVLAGLEALARHARARSGARIVAVTGSAGKTSTKDALAQILGARGPTHAAIKSFNNHWGVPLMLARLPREAAFGVFEIGMSHAGEITPLVGLVRPHVAVITSIGEAHLEHLGSTAAIADAKAEIFSGIEPGGLAVVNADHVHMDRLAERAAAHGVRLLTYGLTEGADYRVMLTQPSPDVPFASGWIEGPGLSMALTLATIGTHTLVNAAGAVLAARALGVDPKDAARVLATHRAGAGRGEIVRLGEGPDALVLIDESYNANPSSIRAALTVLAGLGSAGRKVLVLGDMRELGAAAGTLHRALAEPVRASGADAVWLVGTQMAQLAAALPAGLVRRQCRTVEELMTPLLDDLATGDTVMVKGSNGERLGLAVAAIKARFGGG